MMKTIGSLFTGGGGWEAGAAELGIRPLFGVEMDLAVAAHYDYVFGRHMLVGSVTSVDYRRLPRVDVLVSSPPCQPTSNSGKKARALQRARGLVVEDEDEAEGSFCDPRVGLSTVVAAEALRPGVVLVENSRAYINTPVAAQIMAGLRSLGYHVDARVLDASHYGVVSRRERTILRASLAPLPAWPQPVARPSWYDAIADLVPFLTRAELAPWQASGLAANPPPAGVPLLIAGGNPGRNKRGYIVHRTPDQAAWTTQKAKNTTGLRVVDANGVVRAMSSRAIARLQGFPDWYPMPASRALAIHILGNSVAPTFAATMLRAFH